MTARTDHAKFVADARRHYVPVARWARANGWDMPNWRTFGRGVEIHKTEAWNGHAWQPSIVVIHKDSTLREQYHLTSVAQAIDFLVVAEVLPVEFHSLNAKSVLVDGPPSISDVKKWAEDRWNALSIQQRIDFCYKVRARGWYADWNAILVEVLAVTS